ncbi:MAG TPA: DUF4136 domain-containing protein [Pseudomonadales bacterium]
MRRCQWGWAVALVLTCAGCAAVAPIGADSDYDSSANFTSYRSFGWISDKPLLLTDATLTSPQFQGRAMKAIRQALEARGYGFEADVENADFAVAFTLGTREQIRVNAYPDQVRETWTWGGPVPQAADVRNYTEGTLSIDLFDVHLRRPVWHGWATRTISYADRTNPSPVIAEVVEAILAQFPPQ